MPWKILISTVINAKYSSLCYNVTLAGSVKGYNSFLCCQFAYEVHPVHFDVAYVTDYWIMKHWNAISLCQPRIPAASVPRIAKVSTNVNKFCGVYCPHAFSFDVCTTGDIYPIHILKFYDKSNSKSHV